MRTTPLLAALLLPLLSPTLPAQVSACHDFRALDTTMRGIVTGVPLPGAALSIARDGRLLFRRGYGSYDADTVVPIASATKWLSGAVILSLVDEGLLDLDAPLSAYLPQFNGPSGAMTVRQMFSHTSGMPGDHWTVGSRVLNLEQAVNVLAQVPLRVPPGTDFYYGGVSMHIAGRVAEVVSGRAWADLFSERIAVPIGMSSTDYLGIGTAANPRIAGGARSSTRDYARFLEMIQNDGVFRGRRVLSEAAIATMLSDQSGGVPVSSSPSNYPFWGYGIGCWVVHVDARGEPVEWASPGAFGCTPWIDVRRGTEGVFLVQDLLRRVEQAAATVRSLTREELRFRGLDCFGSSRAACLGNLRIDGNVPRAGRTDFLLRVEAAPPNSAGLLLVTAARLLQPVNVLGVDVWVDPSVGFAASTASDSIGELELAFSLAGLEPGGVAFAQLVFATRPGCSGSPDLASTPGLRIELR